MNSDALKPRKPKALFRRWVLAFWITVAAVAAVSLQAFEIPSTSMENTLLVGDHIFVYRERLAVGEHSIQVLPSRKIQQGDVVVFLSPEERGLFSVKRILAIPGDRVHFRDGVLYRNGKSVDEPYVTHKNHDLNAYRDNFPAVAPSEQFGVRNEEWASSFSHYVDGEDIVVPPNCYFGLGDSRDVSYDSRYFGFIPGENIIGKPLIIYWSFATPAARYQMRDAGDRLSFLAHVLFHFFDLTRWSRIFQVVR